MDVEKNKSRISLLLFAFQSNEIIFSPLLKYIT